YGSVLGATFATLCPDQVERIVVDGVLEMDAYFKGDWARELVDTDKVLDIFFTSCHKAGPKSCAFYASSPAEIRKNLNDLLDSLRIQPKSVFSASTNSYGFIDHALLKGAIFDSLTGPFSSFVPLAQALPEGNGTTFFDFAGGSNFGPQCGSDAEDAISAQIAIQCSEAVPNHDTAADLAKYFHNNSHVSMFLDQFFHQRTHCS
ncbi:hypothetical protein C8J56DRAFT_775023, partial [Mycena floridula]